MPWSRMPSCICAEYSHQNSESRHSRNTYGHLYRTSLLIDCFFCVGFAEELIFRGFLLKRTLDIFSQKWVCVGLNILLFYLIHWFTMQPDKEQTFQSLPYPAYHFHRAIYPPGKLPGDFMHLSFPQKRGDDCAAGDRARFLRCADVGSFSPVTAIFPPFRNVLRRGLSVNLFLQKVTLS